MRGDSSESGRSLHTRRNTVALAGEPGACASVT
jgi:hypothetical protein